MKPLALLVAFQASLVTSFSFHFWDLFYPVKRFHSVDFEAPAVQVTKWDPRCNSGYLFLTPRGPLVGGKARGPFILHPRGTLLWMGREFDQAMNLNVQQYKGEDYLTFWTKAKQGAHPRHKKKSYVMLDSSYNIRKRIYPHGKGRKADSHEFRITRNGTALITIYYKHQVDCTELGLGKKCWVQDGLFQEIDIETGTMLFEWKATDHIHMKDVFSKPSRKDGHGRSKRDAFDYFHINSVDKDDDGNYIVSARYMHAVLCISGRTGEILWQLSGKNNDFEDQDSATDFSWQHHVTWQGNNTISLFDNHANTVFHSPSKHSKGMIIQLNMGNKTASLVQKYPHPNKILNVSQGSVQVIPETGNVLVGFGNSPTFVEFTLDGETLCSARFAPRFTYEIVDFGLVKSYRIFKRPWIGKPKLPPEIKVKGRKLYVSWNGATEVTDWRLETASEQGAKSDGFVSVQELKHDGFETYFELDKKHRYVRVLALGAAREHLAYSAVIEIQRPSPGILWPLIYSTACLLCLTALWWRSYRLLRLPELPQILQIKLANLRGQSAARSIANDEYGSEEAPLLLDNDEV